MRSKSRPPPALRAPKAERSLMTHFSRASTCVPSLMMADSMAAGNPVAAVVLVLTLGPGVAADVLAGAFVVSASALASASAGGLSHVPLTHSCPKRHGVGVAHARAVA